MVKLPASRPTTLHNEWEDAYRNFLQIETMETKLFQLRRNLPILDITRHRDLSSKIRMIGKHKKKWLSIMTGLTRLIKRAWLYLPSFNNYDR